MDRTLKSRLRIEFLDLLRHIEEVRTRAAQNPDFAVQWAKLASTSWAAQNGNGGTLRDYMSAWRAESIEFNMALVMLDECKTICFSAEQAAVFSANAPYREGLDYLLPFSRLFLQFSESVAIRNGDFSDEIIGLLMSQDEINRAQFAAMKQQWISSGGPLVDRESELLYGEEIFEASETPLFNNVIAVYADHNIRRFAWANGTHSERIDYAESDFDLAFQAIRNLAIACIGYINCENIYLHKEGEVPEAVNRKRAKQGKKILEPYYVCRIRGVQYDSNGEPTGEGAHHGFRYDVRGHFRKLTSGKTTWVRPHQRGLANELYIPKTYVVEEGVKVMR